MALATIDLTEDDGFATVDLPGGGQLTFDLYQVHDRLVDVGRQCKDKPAEEYAAATRSVLESLGLPPSLSQRLVMRFVAGVFDAVKQLGNWPGEAGGVTPPASPDSTALLS